MRRRNEPQKEVGLCGECVECKPVYAHHTLTVHGKKPTLGRCRFVENRCVLLSEKGCLKFRKTGDGLPPPFQHGNAG